MGSNVYLKADVLTVWHFFLNGMNSQRNALHILTFSKTQIENLLFTIVCFNYYFKHLQLDVIIVHTTILFYCSSQRWTNTIVLNYVDNKKSVLLPLPCFGDILGGIGKEFWDGREGGRRVIGKGNAGVSLIACDISESF